MIAVDTNILVYAHRADSSFHTQALDCIVQLAEGATLWAIPWPCLHEFLGIVTHPRIYKPPTPLALAAEQVDRWLTSPLLRLLSEEETHWQVLRAQVIAAKIEGPRIHDARIAALCLAHGVSELWTADRDFNRFAGLRVKNPLVEN